MHGCCLAGDVPPLRFLCSLAIDIDLPPEKAVTSILTGVAQAVRARLLEVSACAGSHTLGRLLSDLRILAVRWHSGLYFALFCSILLYFAPAAQALAGIKQDSARSSDPSKTGETTAVVSLLRLTGMQ